MAEAGTLIYFDTNVYSRPFDNQSQPVIQQEANAFLEIIAQVRGGTFRLLSSDILEFEVANILNEEKRSKVRSYLELCSEHVASSEDVLSLGTRIQNSCHVRPRDALHVASAIIGRARFFLSCDNKVTQMKTDSMLSEHWQKLPGGVLLGNESRPIFRESTERRR